MKIVTSFGAKLLTSSIVEAFYSVKDSNFMRRN